MNQVASEFKKSAAICSSDIIPTREVDIFQRKCYLPPLFNFPALYLGHFQLIRSESYQRSRWLRNSLHQISKFSWQKMKSDKAPTRKITAPEIDTKGSDKWLVWPEKRVNLAIITHAVQFWPCYGAGACRVLSGGLWSFNLFLAKNQHTLESRINVLHLKSVNL